MIPDTRLFYRKPKPGDVVEQPLGSGQVWTVREDGMLEPRAIPKRYRPPNTHRYPAKKKKGVV